MFNIIGTTQSKKVAKFYDLLIVCTIFIAVVYTFITNVYRFKGNTAT